MNTLGDVRRSLAPIALLALGTLPIGCLTADDTSQKTQPNCPTGTYQCGYGCLANSSRCCNSSDGSDWNDGTFECPNGQLSTCTPNTGGNCKGAVSSTSTSRYCCSTNSDVGSLDCTDGTVVCNMNCVPVGAVCCSLQNPSNCGTVGGVVESSNTGSSGDQYCYSTSNCIPSVMSNTCECQGATTPG